MENAPATENEVQLDVLSESSAAVWQEYRDTGVAVKEEWLEAVEVAMQGSKPMSKLRGFAGPLLALAFGVAAAIALIIVIAVDEQKTRKVKRVELAPVYSSLTYSDVAAKVESIGAGLMSLGLHRDVRVSIYAETSKEWMICAQACFARALPVVTVYATLGDDALCYALDLTETEVMIADAALLKNIVSIMNGVNIMDGSEERHASIRGLKTVVTFTTPDAKFVEQLSKRSEEHGGPIAVMSLDELIARGASQEAPEATEGPEAGDLAVIMFTSGSTGLPKGVEITHANLVAGVAGISGSLPNLSSDDTYIAYLPLAHVLELVAECCMLCYGATIGYGSPFTLSDAGLWHPRGPNGEVIQRGDAPTLRPTIMAAVPRIMDKVRAGIMTKVNVAGGLKAKLFHMAYRKKLAALAEGRATPFWDALVFDKIRTQALGGRVRMMLSGGGPLSEETQKFMNVVFRCPVGQGYGLTETCGGGTVVWANDRSVGRVGPPILASDIKLVDWAEGGYFSSPSKPGDLPAGEICISGPNVCRGYHKLPEKTAEDFRTDRDGRRWFYTGDIGKMHADGVLQIVDRKKDLVKLAHGEYVSLGKVESRLRGVALIDNICVYADSQEMYCVAIVTLNQANLNLLGDAGQKTLPEICNDPEVKKRILADIAASCRAAGFASFEVPKKVHLCPTEWTPETDLVTTAFKLKRRTITEHYKTELEQLYGKGDKKKSDGDS